MCLTKSTSGSELNRGAKVGGLRKGLGDGGSSGCVVPTHLVLVSFVDLRLRGRGAIEACGFSLGNAGLLRISMTIEFGDLSYDDELINGLINVTSR